MALMKETRKCYFSVEGEDNRLRLRLGGWKSNDVKYDKGQFRQTSDDIRD